jgi:hypothetical protein
LEVGPVNFRFFKSEKGIVTFTTTMFQSGWEQR